MSEPPNDQANKAPMSPDPTSPVPTTLGPGAHKRKLKNYLIDPRFQFKYTGYSVGVAVLVSTVLVGFLWRSSHDVEVQSASAAAQATKAIEESKKLTEAVRTSIVRDYGDNPELLAQYMKDADENDRALAQQARTISEQNGRVIAQQRSMLASLIGGLSLMVMLIAILGVVVTHKVAGPIYKMRTLLRGVAAGKLSFKGRLRRGDELQEFFDDFVKMVDALRLRQAREVEELEAAMQIARAHGASAESIVKIELVHQEMKKALEE
jgi:nitrogen fixation/metabolism regulation signal transduction histidine kinase